jgi:hypothetical protein
LTQYAFGPLAVRIRLPKQKHSDRGYLSHVQVAALALMSKARVVVLEVTSDHLTVTAAARAYGLSRQHIYRLLKRLGHDPDGVAQTLSTDVHCHRVDGDQSARSTTIP